MADSPTIVTNSVPRDVIDAFELTLAECNEFDYIDWRAVDRGDDSASFFRYRGGLYDLGEFSASWGISRDGELPAWLDGWHGYTSDSLWSGMVVRYADDNCERVIVGRFFS